MNNFENMTNEELEQELLKEVLFYTDKLELLCHTLRKQIPKKLVYRIISKLYRMRMETEKGDDAND